jgi:hypothetical protein
MSLHTRRPKGSHCTIRIYIPLSFNKPVSITTPPRASFVSSYTHVARQKLQIKKKSRIINLPVKFCCVDKDCNFLVFANSKKAAVFEILLGCATAAVWEAPSRSVPKSVPESSQFGRRSRERAPVSFPDSECETEIEKWCNIIT